MSGTRQQTLLNGGYKFVASNISYRKSGEKVSGKSDAYLQPRRPHYANCRRCYTTLSDTASRRGKSNPLAESASSIRRRASSPGLRWACHRRLLHSEHRALRHVENQTLFRCIHFHRTSPVAALFNCNAVNRKGNPQKQAREHAERGRPNRYRPDRRLPTKLAWARNPPALASSRRC